MWAAQWILIRVYFDYVSGTGIVAFPAQTFLTLNYNQTYPQYKTDCLATLVSDPTTDPTMTTRYECKLDSKLLKKAIMELNEPENNDERLEEIDKLRNRFLKEQQEFQLLRSDDAFILR